MVAAPEAIDPAVGNWAWSGMAQRRTRIALNRGEALATIVVRKPGTGFGFGKSGRMLASPRFASPRFALWWSLFRIICTKLLESVAGVEPGGEWAVGYGLKLFCAAEGECGA